MAEQARLDILESSLQTTVHLPSYARLVSTSLPKVPLVTAFQGRAKSRLLFLAGPHIPEVGIGSLGLQVLY